MQIFQLLHFLEQSVLIFYQIQVVDNLAVKFQQIVIHLAQLQLHVGHYLLQLHVHGNYEERGLLFVNHPLTLVYQHSYVMPLLI